MQRARRNALRRGFRERSLYPLITGLAAAALVVIGLNWAFASGAVTRLPEKHFLRWEQDDPIHIIWRLGQLRRHPPEHTPVYLLGGSSMRECIPSERTLAVVVASDTGRLVTVVQLGQFNRSFAEDIAVVDNLPVRPGLVVIGLSLKMFSFPPGDASAELKGEKLPLRSPSLRAILDGRVEVPARYLDVSPGVLDYLWWYARYHHSELMRLSVPSVEYSHHRYKLRDRRGLDRNRQDAVQRLSEMGEDLTRNEAFNIYLLRRLIELTIRRGHRVLLLELPVDREAAGQQWNESARPYRQACHDMAKEYGLLYVDPNSTARLQDSDFADLVHLVAPGRSKWQPHMARAISQALSRP
jgi:hypothetical protein